MLIRVGNIAFKDMYKLQFIKQTKINEKINGKD